MYRLDSEDGFTLMEAVLAVGLLAMVSFLSLGVLINILKSTLKSQAAVDIEQASSFVLLQLEEDIKKSSSALAGADSKSITISGPYGVSVYQLSQGCANCNGVSINCVTVSRNNEPTVRLTDTTCDSVTLNPASSAVSIDYTGSGFSVISSAGKDLAVDIKIKFFKPTATNDPSMFRAETTMETTLVLGTANL